MATSIDQQRNETTHGHDEKSRNEARRDRAEIMLCEIYSRRDFSMQPSDRDLFLFASIDRYLVTPTNSIVN
jgi:hypothetical protein